MNCPSKWLLLASSINADTDTYAVPGYYVPHGDIAAGEAAVSLQVYRRACLLFCVYLYVQ